MPKEAKWWYACMYFIFRKITIYLVICPHSNRVFSTLDKDQLEKTRRHHCKERLKISKIAKFESETSWASDDIAPESCKNLQTFIYGGVGASLCPPPRHTNVCKISRL